jgi:hypothetical protein
MNTDFSIFIKDNINTINGILEIGAGNGNLSENILKLINTKYTIIDPYYYGECQNKTIINDYIENIELNNIFANTIIMSHVFEHFYDPYLIMEKIENSKNIEYICLNFPDLETYIKNGTYHVLNAEHTFYIDNNYIENLFVKHNFELLNHRSYQDHSVFFLFKRTNICTENVLITKNNPDLLINAYYKNIYDCIDKIHDIIFNNIDKDIYIWPCSMHTIYLFVFGLNHLFFKNILDNSPSKINKFLYGYNLLCKSFDELISTANKSAIIFINGGCFNKELSLQPNNNIIYININEI